MFEQMWLDDRATKCLCGLTLQGHGSFSSWHRVMANIQDNTLFNPILSDFYFISFHSVIYLKLVTKFEY